MNSDFKELLDRVCLLEGQPVSQKSLAAIVRKYENNSTLFKTIKITGAEKDFNTKFIADHEETTYLWNRKVRICHNCRDTADVHELYVFIHGLGGELEQFEPLLRLIDAIDRRFLTFDLPGFGKSDEWDTYPMLKVVEYIQEIVAKFHPGKVILVGHSMGCFLVLHFSDLYHTNFLIDKILLLSPPKRVVQELKGNMVQWGIWLGFNMPWLFDLYRSYFDQCKGLSSSGIQGFFSSKTISATQTYRKLWQFHNNVQIKSKSIFGYLSGWEPIRWDRLNNIWQIKRVALAVICGNKDVITPMVYAQEIFESVPENMDKKLIIIPNCGHHICFDTPEETCRLFYQHIVGEV